MPRDRHRAFRTVQKVSPSRDHGAEGHAASAFQDIHPDAAPDDMRTRNTSMGYCRAIANDEFVSVAYPALALLNCRRERAGGKIKSRSGETLVPATYGACNMVAGNCSRANQRINQGQSREPDQPSRSCGQVESKRFANPPI